MRLTVIVLAVIQGIAGAKSPEHYCAINTEHTMCLYRKFNSMGLRCRHYHAMPTNGVKWMMLNKHNYFRNNYASHSKREFTVPNMRGLEWDEELAEISARWAMQCPYYEDDFRDVDRFKVANMVEIGSHESSFLPLHEVWGSLITGNLTFHKLPDDFEDRRQNKLESAFKLDQPLTLITNPYFQYVGCAAAVYRQFVVEDELFRTILVCNYGPLYDSYDKDQPAGLPCTRCPDDTYCHRNSSYPNLCFASMPDDEKPQARAIEPRADWYDDEDDQYDSPEDVLILPGDGYRSSNNTLMNEDQNIQQLNRTNKYCDIVCNNGAQHTMCKYQDKTKDFDEVVPLLGKPSKEYILTMHNGIRDDVAGTKPLMEAGPKLPLAANMREMIWSEELEKIAHRWAMQCKEEKDECRDIYLEDHPVPVYVSQLIYVTNWTGMEIFPSVTDAFYAWMLGMPFFTVDELNLYREPPDEVKDYAPFAQIIWADTFMLGCAMTLCRSRESNDSRVVTACNYAPGGMIPGKRVFKVGGPCSDCPKLFWTGSRGNHCSEEYKSLCAVRITGRSRFLNPLIIPVYRSEVDQLFENIYKSQGEDGIVRERNFYERESCTHKCFEKDVHTLCKYKVRFHKDSMMYLEQGISKDCHNVLIHNDGIERIVNMHNELRDIIASGWYTETTPEKLKKSFPKASNMRKMIWNEELAETALRWASQCILGKDKCRDLTLTGSRAYVLNKHEVPDNDLMRVGQMIAWKDWDVRYEQPSLDAFFNEWVDEIVNFSTSNIAHYVKNANLISHHFAQLIWARSYMVGCALVSWEDGKPGFRLMFLVCNYAPRGRQEWLPVYLIGGPCTGCEPLYAEGTDGMVCSRIHQRSLCETDYSLSIKMGSETKQLFLHLIILQIIKSLLPN